MERNEIREMALEEREEDFQIIEEFLDGENHQLDDGEEFQEVIGICF